MLADATQKILIITVIEKMYYFCNKKNAECKGQQIITRTLGTWMEILTLYGLFTSPDCFVMKAGVFPLHETYTINTQKQRLTTLANFAKLDSSF